MPDYVWSEEHQRQMWSGDEPRGSLMRDFEAAFIIEARRRDIPVHAAHRWPDCLSMVHSVYGMRLQSDDWAVLGRIGYLAVRAVGVSLIGWGGGSFSGVPDGAYEPDLWYQLEKRARKP